MYLRILLGSYRKFHRAAPLPYQNRRTQVEVTLSGLYSRHTTPPFSRDMYNLPLAADIPSNTGEAGRSV